MYLIRSVHCCKLDATLKKLCSTNDGSFPRSTDHRLRNRKRFYSIDIPERWLGHIRDRRELSRNIAEFSTAGKRIIITSVCSVLDNSTVIKDRLPPFVVYIFITNIRKVLPYCIVRSMEMCTAHRTYSYQRLCGLMHVSNSSLACIDFVEDTSSIIWTFSHRET